MSIFQRIRSGKKSKLWYWEGRDHFGLIRRLPLFREKRASEEAGRNIENLIAFKQAKKPFNAGILAFIESLPAKIMGKLTEWGIISQSQAGMSTPLMIVQNVRSVNGRKRSKVTGGHLADFQTHMETRELASRHIKQVISCCVQLITFCQFISPSDISQSKVESYLRYLRDADKSARTVNRYLIAFKTFCNWMLCNEIICSDPLKRISKFKEETDKRYVRGILGEEEISLLLSHCEQAPLSHGLSGWQRRLLYQLAIETGLRWSELYSLKRCDFDFSEQPYVKIAAENAKNRKLDVLPLRPELAKMLEEYFNAHLYVPGGKAFKGMWKRRGSEMLQQDLTDIGIDLEDELGRKRDFHCLRHTCGTRLARSGVLPQVAMRIMRHSSIDLTLKYYTHLALEDKSSAVAKFPQITPKPNLRMTGTDCTDKQPNPKGTGKGTGA